VEGPPRELHPIPRDEIYRITREALRNAFSHSRARQIEAEITYDPRRLRLRIRDDGRGIDPAILEAGRSGHYGLPGMRERATQIGAKLNIWSGVGTGTEIELSIPGSIAYGASPGRSRFRWFRKIRWFRKKGGMRL
jgi:signal transduction histidine kinase